MKTLRFTAIALLVGAWAGFALAQNVPYTAGPSRNDYRLRVMQPVEGATITGNQIQIVVDTEIPSERDTRQDINSTPRPDVDVFVDGIYQQTMRDEKNVVNLENVQPGPHTITLLALNRSREPFDRKEVHVVVVAAPVAARPAERPAKVAPAPAPAPAYVPPPAPAPQVAAEPLPKTGTADPLLAAAGLALLAGGLALRRFV